MPLYKDFPNFGLIYGSILWILIIIFMIMQPRTPTGLAVNFKEEHDVGVEKSPWTDFVNVYLDAKIGFLVSGQAVKREELQAKLKEKLGRQMVWTVYFEADGDCLYMDAAYAIDTIQGLGAKLIWVTPRTREEWKKRGVY